jgi:hypothetical protein
MLARSKLVLLGRLRSGNSGSARGASGFLAEALAPHRRGARAAQ